MQSINVRLATPTDLSTLADIWYENKVLNQQSDAGLVLVSGAKDCWAEEANQWLANPRCHMWVATRDRITVGFIVVWLQEMPPGLSPSLVGCVTEMALDLHTPSGGAGQALLSATRDWLTTQGVCNIIAHVPHRQPVQQAFWHGQGARDWVDLMWLKL